MATNCENDLRCEFSGSVLTPDELSAMLVRYPHARMLDVRTPGEFESSHIEGAYNVPLDTLSEHAKEIQASVCEPVVLICQSGRRANQAQELLQKAGMSNLFLLNGGMNAWTNTGKPIKEGRKRLSLERQVRIVAGALAVTGALLALMINPLFSLLPLFVGSGLMFAGITDTCGMAMLLAKLPYNRPTLCDTVKMVEALKAGR